MPVKKLVVGLLAGLSLGTFAGFAGGIFVYPYWFPPPPAMEAVANLAEQKLLATGQFIHANPSDPVHWGKGEVMLYEDKQGARLVHLGADFQVGPGPRFHVYVVDRPDVLTKADFLASDAVDLGRLRAFRGSQNYPVPAGVKLAKSQSVVVWCKEFNVLITPATLMRRTAPVA
jgi:Electron transfer DM13